MNGYGGSSNKLGNEDAIYEFLDSYHEETGMPKITSLHMYRHEASDPLD